MKDDTPMNDNDKKNPDSPNEFSSFVRRIGINAFDNLATKLGVDTEQAGEEVSTGPVQKLAATWKSMNTPDKEKFFDQLIFAGSTAVAAAPAVLGLMKLSRSKKVKTTVARAARKTSSAAKTAKASAASAMGMDSQETSTKSKKDKKGKKNKKGKRDKKSKKKDNK